MKKEHGIELTLSVNENTKKPNRVSKYWAMAYN